MKNEGQRSNVSTTRAQPFVHYAHLPNNILVRLADQREHRFRRGAYYPIPADLVVRAALERPPPDADAVFLDF